MEILKEARLAVAGPSRSWRPAEPLIAFRTWLLPADTLLPLTPDGRAWMPGAARAECDGRRGTLRHAPEDVPHGLCTCGWHARYRPPAPQPAGGSLVVGAVQMWGAVELHEGGLRAEHARPVVLAAPPHDAALRARLTSVAAAHGASIVPAEELVAAAAEFGSPLPLEEEPMSGLGLLAAALEWASDPDHEPPASPGCAAIAAFATVLEAARSRGYLATADPDALLCTVCDAAEATSAAYLELARDRHRGASELAQRALALAGPSFGLPASPTAALTDLCRVGPWYELHARVAARHQSSPHAPEFGPATRVRYVLSQLELRALLTAAARPDQLGDPLIDRIAGVAAMRVRQPDLAALLFERGSRARAVIETLLAADDESIDAALRERVARAVVANGALGLAAEELVDAICTIPDEVSDDLVVTALRCCSSSHGARRLLAEMGARGVAAAHICVDDPALAAPVRAACVAAIGAPARDQAARLLASDPAQFSVHPELQEVLGEDATAERAHALAADPKIGFEQRVECARLLPFHLRRPVMELLLGEARDADERAIVLRATLSPLGSEIDAGPVYEAVRCGGLPPNLVLALIEAHPGAAAELARPLWDEGALDPYQAACVLDCLWPDAPALARTQVREFGPAYRDASRAARLAAAIGLLGHGDDQAIALCRVMMADPAAPLHLRVLAVRVLGSAAADLADQVLNDPETPASLAFAISLARLRANTWPWTHNAALRGLPS